MIDDYTLREAKETPEGECFDCMDYKRGGTVCPAHAQIRKEKLAVGNKAVKKE